MCAEGWEGRSIFWTASSGEVRDRTVHWSVVDGWECWHRIDGGSARYERLDAETPLIMPWDAPKEAVVKQTGGWRVRAA